jgi:hypothetical protein
VPATRSTPLTCLLLTVAPAAFAQEACSTYTVQAGDTLGKISLTAYGELNYQLLYNANFAVLRDDPSAPAPGTVLQIPCPDGRLSAADALPEVPVADPVSAAAAAPEVTVAKRSAYRPEIRIVSGDDWVPFADPSLTDGGLFLRISTMALDRAGPEYRHMVGWVEDWEAHIFALLPTGAFDMATGWNDPGCANLVNPSERTLYLCDNFLFSDPIYETTFGFFSTPDNPYAAATSFADLAGARLCRAEGNVFQDLEAQGLLEPMISLSMEFDEDTCLQRLLEGAYDVVSFETEYAKVILPEMGIEDQVVQSAILTTIQSSVAIAHKSNRRAAEYIAHLNRGLADLRASGEWSEIVASTLAEAAALEAE